MRACMHTTTARPHVSPTHNPDRPPTAPPRPPEPPTAEKQKSGAALGPCPGGFIYLPLIVIGREQAFIWRGPGPPFGWRSAREVTMLGEEGGRWGREDDVIGPSGRAASRPLLPSAPGGRASGPSSPPLPPRRDLLFLPSFPSSTTRLISQPSQQQLTTTTTQHSTLLHKW